MNLGIFLISQSFALASRLPGVSTLFASSLRDAATGQSTETDFRGGIPTLSAYAAMAQGKTGALFALPAQAAAVLKNLPDRLVSQIGRAFVQLGAAYQVQDDLADALGLKGRARAGLDLREGKANSIVVLHLAQVPADRASFLLFQQNRAARCNEVQTDKWLSRLFASGSVVLAQKHLQELCNDLVIVSATLPPPFSLCLSELAMSIADPARLQQSDIAALSHVAS